MAVVTPSCNFYNSEKYPLNLMTSMISIIDNAIMDVNQNESASEEEKSQVVYRLKAMKVTPMAMIFKNYDDYYNTRTKKDFAKEFLTLCEEVSVKSLGGGQSVADLKKANGLE